MVATLFDCGYAELVPALLPDDASSAADAIVDAENFLQDAPLLFPHLLTSESMVDIAVQAAQNYVAESDNTAVYMARSIVSANAMSVLLKLDDKWFDSLREHLADDDFKALTFCSGAIVNDSLEHFVTKDTMNHKDVPIACFRGFVGPKYGLQSPATTAPVQWAQGGVDMEPLYRPAQALVYMHLKLCAALKAKGESTELPLGSRLAMHLLCAQEGAVKALPVDMNCLKEGLGFIEDREVPPRSACISYIWLDFFHL